MPADVTPCPPGCLNELASLARSTTALVAAEKQRVADKGESDALRSQVRIAEERWKTGVETRLEDLKTELDDVGAVVAKLPTAIDSKLTAQALVSATALKAEAEVRARDLKDAAALVAIAKRRAEDGAAVKNFLTRGTRVALSVSVTAALALVGYLLFHDGETDLGEVIAFIAICAPFIIFVLSTTRRKT